jgi:hypothetical protein
MFIMDFDRHEDQWRWGADENDEENLLSDTRDRDQAFFVSDGFIPFFIHQWIQPSSRAFVHIQQISIHLILTPVILIAFLNELSQKDRADAVDAFLPLMTDAAIETAIRQQPRSYSLIRKIKLLKH